MSDDEIKKLILARRARFIAAAVVGLVACEPGVDGQPPNVCLSISVPPPEDGGEMPTIVDAGVSADPDGSYVDATVATEPDSDAPPMPCLAPPLPTVCLSVSPTPPPPIPPMLDAGRPPPRPCLSPKPPPQPPRICLSFSGPDD